MRYSRTSILISLGCFLLAFIYIGSSGVGTAEAAENSFVNGVLGQYYDSAQPDNISYKRMIRIDDNIRFNWQTDSPHPSIEPDSFSVVWSGYIEVPVTGNYDIYTYSDDGVQFSLGDGGLLIDRWGLVNLEFTKSNRRLSLQQGVKYPFTLKYQEMPLNATIVLFWHREGGSMEIIPSSAFYVCQNHYDKYRVPVLVNQPRASGGGLKGEYFIGAQSVCDSNATPDHVVAGENVAFEWGAASPATGIPEDDFSVRWSGYLEARYSEDVTLQIAGDDGVRLWIDDELLIDNWEPASNILYEASIPMVNGRYYKIKIEYNDLYGSATCVLFWKSAGEGKEIIPAKYLYSNHPGENPPGPNPDPGPCSGEPEIPIPEPGPNAEFIEYLMDNKIYVYGNNAEITGSSTISGANASVVIRNNFAPGTGDVSYITCKNIYIKGDVTLGGSAGLGSFDGSSRIYVDGDVNISGSAATAGHDGRVFGKLYYTGELSLGNYGINLAAETQKVDSIAFPQFTIPGLRSDEWYNQKGYTHYTAAQDNMKYYGGSFTFLNGHYNNVVVASKGDINLGGSQGNFNVHVNGILFAPNGKVALTHASSFTGIVIAKELSVLGNAKVTFLDIADVSRLPF